MFLSEFDQQLLEKWSEKYKRSIDCSHPRGFSQRAHCQGRNKNEDQVVDEYRVLSRYDPTPEIRQGEKEKDNLDIVRTPLTMFTVRHEEEYDGELYYFYDKKTDRCVGFFSIQTEIDSYSGLKRLLKPGIRAVTPHMGLATEVRRQGISTLVYNTFLRGGPWVFVTDQHTQGASRLWDSLVKNDIVSFYVSDETGKPIKEPFSYHDYRILGPRDRFNIIKPNVAENSTGKKSAIYSTDVYGSTAYHAKCLEPNCGWESKRYDSIKLAQNWAKKHAETHFKQGVAEAFDQPYKLKWEKSEHGDYDALATLNDGTYLTIMFNNEYKKNWMVEFYRNNSQAVTGEGDAQRIFATVLTAIKQFITKKKPQSLFFSAVKEDDPSGSRTKLYDRLVQRYAGNLGYSVQRQEHPGQMAYKLIRSNQTNENFADGKKPGRKGLAKRSGVNCKQSVTKLRKIAKNSSGERQRMAHWCANMKSGKRKTNESVEYSKLQSALNDFLPLAMQELKLKQVPKIRLLKKINHGGQPSFGSFGSDGINLGVQGRHPVDVCRTLAHELVHYKQGTLNQLDQHSGETGSAEENQANSLAGVIMRKFSKQFPQHIS